MINIIASGNHGAHISLLATLLNIEHRLIGSPCIWDMEHETAYNYALEKLKTELQEPQQISFWKWYFENQIEYSLYVPADYDVFIDSDSSLEETVLEFLKRLDDLNIVKGLHLWLTNSHNNRAAIKKSWEMVLGYTPDANTIEHWNERSGRVLKNKIDFFSWTMIVRFCKESKRVEAHLKFYDLFKVVKWTMPLEWPLMAIFLSGHARNYVRGKSELFDYIYTDVFIHTWSTLERRMTPRYIDESDLETAWIPVSYEIEDLSDILKSEFSLLGKQDLLFFSMHQHDADPSLWENADLYSMNKAGLLIKAYEISKGRQYDAVCRLPFIYDLKKFDLMSMYEKITKDVLWMPKGGCTSCNREFYKPIGSPAKAHDEHINKLNAYWMFGKRDIMMLALNMYVDANNMLDLDFESNEANYVECAKHKKFRNIVHVYGKEYTQQHHTGVSMSLFNKSNLLRIQMQDYYCVGCDDISGDFPRFELHLHADGW